MDRASKAETRSSSTPGSRLRTFTREKRCEPARRIAGAYRWIAVLPLVPKHLRADARRGNVRRPCDDRLSRDLPQDGGAYRGLESAVPGARRPHTHGQA